MKMVDLLEEEVIIQFSQSVSNKSVSKIISTRKNTDGVLFFIWISHL